jgi:hypothetical protein
MKYVETWKCYITGNIMVYSDLQILLWESNGEGCDRLDIQKERQEQFRSWKTEMKLGGYIKIDFS